MEIRIVYMTAGSIAEARDIGKQLVSERLAACVNLMDGMRSIYRWNGDIQEEGEAILIAKTTEEKLPVLVEKVKSLHSYDCPCIVSLPVSGGNAAFLQWVAGEVD